MPNGFMNAETEEQVYNAAKIASENLGKARDYLKSFKEDDNIVSQAYWSFRSRFSLFSSNV